MLEQLEHLPLRLTDMKKTIIALSMCLWAPVSWAFPPGFLDIITSSGGGADYCVDKLGSYSLYYDADHPGGTAVACKIGGSSSVTLVISDINTTVNNTGGGTYGILHSGSNSYARIPVVDSGLTPTNGKVSFDIKLPASMPTADISLFEYGNTVNANGLFVKLQYNATGAGGQPGFRANVNHCDGSTTNANTSYLASTVLADSWVTISADWNSTTGFVNATMTGATNGHVSGAISAFTDTTYIYFGENIMNFSTYNHGVDNIKTGTSQQ